MFELIDNFSLCPKVSLKDLLFRMRKQKRVPREKAPNLMRLLRKIACSVWVGSWTCPAKIWYVGITEAS